jgi:endonuclease/exonuclease/phosphatase (EEP) superfamily protein YafD
MTANLEYGGAEADTLVREALSQSDLLAVQELTGEAVRQLQKAGLEVAFPFKTIHPQQDAGGVGLWSRYPIASSRLISGFQMPLVDAAVRTGPGDDTLRLLVVHLAGPWPQPITGWQRDIAALDATLRRVTDEAGTDPVVVAGDFNATSDLRPFRDLLRHGYGNAAAQAGEGRLPTFPNGAKIPAALDIDHILTRNCAVASAGTIPLRGSDHRALIATVEFS